MICDVHFVEDLRDLAFFVDQERGALDAHVLFTVHRLLFPNAVFLHDVLFRIGKQVEGKIVFRPEFLMRLFTVGGNAEQLYILFVEGVVRVPERACFERSARCVVFRIEKQHNSLAFEVRKLYRIPVLIFGRKCGCLIAFFEHRFTKIDILGIVTNAEART